MRRILLYAAALTILLLGGRGTDIGRLRPVELVQLTEQGGVLVLRTDTGDKGWGLTIEQAAKNLKETTAGQIYLDTADFLLLEEGAEKYLPALGHYLKKETAIVYGPQNVDLEEAAAYLRVHKPSESMKNAEKPLENLVFEGGRLILKKFQEK